MVGHRPRQSLNLRLHSLKRLPRPRPDSRVYRQRTSRLHRHSGLQAEINRGNAENPPVSEMKIEKATQNTISAPGATPNQHLQRETDSQTAARSRSLGKTRSPNPAAPTHSPSTAHAKTMHIHHSTPYGQEFENTKDISSREEQAKSSKTVKSSLSQNQQEKAVKIGLSIKERTQEAASKQPAQTQEKTQDKGQDHDR